MPIIKVENLSKKYILSHVRQQTYTAIRDVIAEKIKSVGKNVSRFLSSSPLSDPSHEEFWALKNLSFEIEQGDRVGIIGRNGAGKSTLLKILSRITEPTEGRIGIRGRVASLLEVGTGFHPELTGRENIFLNGAILGMARGEIREKFDEIVAFAEVEKFLDTPVKRYSSGMYVRLAFAVAAHLEPEILIVDEVLAVGDMAFQKKCMGKMEDISHAGRTLIFVSHNMGAVSELCNKAILIDKGQLKNMGTARQIIGDYSRLIDSSPATSFDRARYKNNLSEIVDIDVYNEGKDRKNIYDIDDTIYIAIVYEVKEYLEGLQITATLYRDAVEVTHTFHTDDMDHIPSHAPGLYQATAIIPGMFLKAGHYRARITAGTPQQLIADIPDGVFFDIYEMSVNTQHKGFKAERPGNVIFPGKWQWEKR